MRRKIEYYFLYVGDDPDSEIVRGPFDSYDEAHSHVGSYHSFKKEHIYDSMRGWHGQLDSSYVIWNCHKVPTYHDTVLDRLKKEY